jgi:hypothetical protein
MPYSLNIGLRIGLSNGLNKGLSLCLVYWLLLGLWNSLSQKKLGDRDRIEPNQGVRQSVRNGLIIGLLAGCLAAFAGFFPDILIGKLSVGMLQWLDIGGDREIMTAGLFFEYGMQDILIMGFAGAILALFFMGGLAGLRHLLLRLQLRRLGVVPRHYVRFLDDAARRILLYKDGGGYRFIHRLFLEYFADLEADPSSALSAPGTGIAQEQTAGVTAAPQSS